MTKYTDSGTLERLLVILGLEKRDGRAEVAPQMEKQEVCVLLTQYVLYSMKGCGRKRNNRMKLMKGCGRKATLLMK